MSCKLAIIGLLCLVYCTGSVYAAPGDACPNGASDCSAGNNEVCNADPVCECNAATYYAPSDADSAICVISCAVKNPTPAGYVLTGITEEGNAITVACDAGYDGTPDTTPLNCQVGGDYDNAFGGCTAKDCASNADPTGYTNLANTLYGQTATADCDDGNGYAGTAVPGACQTDGTWAAFTGCTLADCTSATVDAGYLVTGDKSWGGSPTVACDTGYTGTAAAVTCGVNSQWSAFSGCTSSGGGGIDLGNACSTNLECTSGTGGSGSKCDTNCVCDATRNYVENSSTCKLATDLGNACSANEECTLGNGGAGATCSTNCVCDEASGYTESGSTCTKNAGTNLLSMFNVVSMLAFILMVKLM